MAVPRTTHGITIGMATLTLPANLLNVDWDGPKREMYDGSHLGTTGAKPYLADPAYDPGTLDVEFQFDNSSTNGGSGLVVAMADITERVVTITWAATDTTLCGGFVQDFSTSGPRGIQTGRMKIKLSGAITI